MTGWKRGALVPGLAIGLGAALPVQGTGRGHALLLAAVCGLVLLVAGIRLNTFCRPWIAGAIGVGVFISTTKLRSDRIYSGCTSKNPQTRDFSAYPGDGGAGIGGLIGKGLGRPPAKAWLPSRTPHRFYFSLSGKNSDWCDAAGGSGFCGDRDVRLLDLAARADTSGCCWVRADVFDWLAGAHQHRVVTSALPNKGPAAALHQLWRIEFADDAHQRRDLLSIAGGRARPSDRGQERSRELAHA